MSRPGDWRCSQCNNHNFKFRTSCNRCGCDKPTDAMFELPKVDCRGKIRPGDWTCCGCDNRNFAFRDECNRCDLPRYVTQTLFSASLLDDEAETSCPGLGLQLLHFHNASLIDSSSSNIGPSSGSGADSSSIEGSPRNDPVGTPPSLKKKTVPSQALSSGSTQNWRCSSCWNMNYDYRMRCNRCQLPHDLQGQQLQHPVLMDHTSSQHAQGFYTQPSMSAPSTWGVQSVSS